MANREQRGNREKKKKPKNKELKVPAAQGSPFLSGRAVSGLRPAVRKKSR